ncbi:MAG: hypothetical protein ACTHMP_18995 [Thermomicrobiales bacterium]
MSATANGRAGTAAPVAPVNRVIAPLPLFDPAAGTTVIEPLGSGPGWWAGAPGAYWTGDRFYLVYRLRRPQPQRGGETHIAVSDDGEHFETIWTAQKDDFNSPSIERSALLRTDEGRWRLYVSYVDGADGRWRIDLLEADAPEHFDAATRVPVLTAADIQAEGVKDPYVCRVGGEWHMFASYAPTPEALLANESREDAQAKMHGTRDIYNTGTSKSLSGLATSVDGRRWQWEGPILEPRDGTWDAYAARLNSVVWRPPVWFGYYDGSASVAENYEERCGAVYSFDLRHWRRLSLDGPALGAAGGPGSVRYVEAVQGSDWIRYFYEWTRPDGAHELRTILRR